MSARPWTVELRGLLTDNLVYKLVSLLCALTLWLWVQSEQEVTERVRVRLDWDLPEGTMLTEPPLESALVTVEGVQAYARAVRQQSLRMRLDLTAMKEGEVSLTLADQTVEGLSSRLRVVSVSPERLDVKLDRAQRRRLPVTVATRGQVPPGFAVKSISVEPDRVEVTGPASVLRGLKELVTDEVDLSSLREDADFDVGLGVKKGQLLFSKDRGFVVKVAVEAVTKERRLDDVPVVVRGDASRVVGVSTVQVLLSGPVDQLDALDPEEVSVLLYVPDGVEAGVARAGEGPGLRFEVVHPGGEHVRVVSVTPAEIPVGPKAGGEP